jgi:anaerobic magnesium-protoporphyrin IX monomethyl ester cyclase
VFFMRDREVAGTRAETFVNLANVPEIPFDLVEVERYISSRPDLGIDRYFEVCTSRGCPHRCGFCYIESVHGSRWRSVEAAACVAHIKAMIQRFGIDGISFREDNFFVRRARVEAIARALIDQDVRVKWAASCRINYAAHYTPAFLKLLRESGCVLLTFGVESGSDRMLEFIHKDITVAQVLAVAHKMHDSGIRATYHFMGGFPTEAVEEFLATCRLIDALRMIAPDTVVREMSIFAPYPGIGLIPACAQRGYREPQSLEEWVAMDWSHPDRPWLTREQSRLIADAQFLIARLAHRNPAIRTWAQRRWRQLIGGTRGIRLPERPWIEAARRVVRRRSQERL